MVILHCVGNSGHLHGKNMFSASSNYKALYRSVYSAAALNKSSLLGTKVCEPIASTGMYIRSSGEPSRGAMVCENNHGPQRCVLRKINVCIMFLFICKKSMIKFVKGCIKIFHNSSILTYSGHSSAEVHKQPNAKGQELPAGPRIHRSS